MKKIYKTVFPEDFNFNTLSSRPSLISSIREGADCWLLPGQGVVISVISLKFCWDVVVAVMMVVVVMVMVVVGVMVVVVV